MYVFDNGINKRLKVVGGVLDIVWG